MFLIVIYDRKFVIYVRKFVIYDRKLRFVIIYEAS